LDQRSKQKGRAQARHFLGKETGGKGKLWVKGRESWVWSEKTKKKSYLKQKSGREKVTRGGEKGDWYWNWTPDKRERERGSPKKKIRQAAGGGLLRKQRTDRERQRGCD